LNTNIDMKTQITFLFAFLVVVACEEITIPLTESEDTYCEVSFSMAGNEMTKSSATIRDDYLHDMQVWAMANGSEMDDEGIATGTVKKMRLRKNEYYSFYAVANLGKFPVWNPQEYILEAFRYGFNGIKLLQILMGVPMSCVVEDVYLDSDKMTIELPFERMLAEYSISVDKSNLVNTQITVTSATLMQAPTDMYVFRHGSKAVKTEQGDYMSAADLEVLNGGGKVKLYALENCQGVLLPGNTDQKKKIPSALYPDVASKCTYLEMRASFTRNLPEGGTVSGNNLVYRYYLGRDATTDFSVVRNTRYNIDLVLSDLDLNSSSWRISPGEYY